MLETTGRQPNSRLKSIVKASIALTLVCAAFLLALTAYAWFYYGRTAAGVVEISNPNAIFINAANQEPWFENGVTEVGPRELEQYIEKGGVYVLLHAGIAVNPQWVRNEPKFRKPAEVYQKMIGCQFLGHPPRCAVTVHVENPEHPIMEGVEDFTERDEHYQLEIKEEFVTTLFETSSETGGTQPGGFLFVKGNGRVVVITPGHTLSVWKNPNFQRILKNLIQYYCFPEA